MNLASLLPDWNSLDSVRLAHSRLELWAILLFAALVVCDVIAHLIEDKHKRTATIFERIGLVCFAIAVSAELAAYKYGQRNDELSENVIISLNQKSKEALTASGTAITQSKQAIDTSNTANSTADAAGKKAERAIKEADSFESDIVSAKKQAADAESHLLEAVKRADVVTAKLDRLTTPRSLPHSPQMISSLMPFKGTEYMFTGVCEDKECVDLLRDIDSVLEGAGWKRIKSPHRFPGLVLWGEKKDDDGAGIDLIPGIKLSIESPDPNIEGRTVANLPQYIQAAVFLNGVLAANVIPPENTGRLVEKTLGSSTVISISVGRKPLP